MELIYIFYGVLLDFSERSGLWTSYEYYKVILNRPNHKWKMYDGPRKSLRWVLGSEIKVHPHNR